MKCVRNRLTGEGSGQILMKRESICTDTDTEKDTDKDTACTTESGKSCVCAHDQKSIPCEGV